jgi:hypothetical protein
MPNRQFVNYDLKSLNFSTDLQIGCLHLRNLSALVLRRGELGEVCQRTSGVTLIRHFTRVIYDRSKTSYVTRVASFSTTLKYARKVIVKSIARPSSRQLCCRSRRPLLFRFRDQCYKLFSSPMTFRN